MGGGAETPNSINDPPPPFISHRLARMNAVPPEILRGGRKDGGAAP